MRIPGELYERLLRFGKRLAAPVEAFSERSVERVSTFADTLNKAETRALDVGQVLLRPIKFVARLPRRILALLVSPRRLEAIGKPIRRAAKRIREAFVGVAEALFIDRFFIRFAQLTRPLWYPLAAFAGFVAAWWQTRKLRRLWWGVPLFVLLLPLPVLAGWFVFGGRSGVAANYEAAIADARAAKDYARMALFERKLAQLGVDTRRTEFNSVLTLERDGQLNAAYERAQRLAGEDVGYPPAHLWIVEHLLTQKLGVPADESQRLVEQHLSALSKLGVRGRQITILRGLSLVQGKKLREAAEVFAPLVDEVPLAAIERFQIDLQLQRRDDARRDALAVREQLARQRRNGNALKAGDYQCWANAEKFLNDLNRYRAVVVDWMEVDPHNVEARKGMATIYLADFDVNLQSAQPDAKLLATRLQDAFALTEIPEDVKLRVAALYRQRSLSRVLRDAFNELANSSNLSASLAEVLGTVAGVEGEWAQAEAWMRQAIVKDDRDAIAWNNLACILLQKGDPKVLDEALVAANRAVTLAAADYRFRETRGQILLRLKRPQEAVSDLEFALNGMPEAAAVHRSLALAYEELGNKELAAQHRDQAQ